MRITREVGHTKGAWTLQDDETPWTCGDARTAIEMGEELGHTEILFSLLNESQEPIAYLPWEPMANEERCEELRANAALIAAAPELLELVKECVNGLNCQPGYVRSLTLQRMQAAIFKAEGG